MKKLLTFLLTVILAFSFATSNIVMAASNNSVRTSISKLESKPKGFKVSWNKKSKIKGYQIQYSTSSNFKKSSSKTKTIAKAQTTSTTIRKLKGCNKKYYVRVRTYKVLNGEKLYSAWSKTKNVNTLNHKYSKATCTKAKVCKYCEKTIGKKKAHTYHNSVCTGCGKIKFKTLSYTGTNQGIVAENINIPKGKYRVLISFNGTSDFGGWLNVDLCGDNYYESFSSVDSGTAKINIINGPIKNGMLLIDGHEGVWKITIEKF